MYHTRALLYRLLVIATGIGWLLVSLRAPHDPIRWEIVGIFVLVSWLVKRAGFRVVAEVTHSLVNVVDVGAMLVLGPLGGALVGTVSSILHVQFSTFRRREWRWYEMIDLPLFDGSVKAILALLGGYYYQSMGGPLAPTTVTTEMVLPLTLLFLLWFALDHLFWTGLFLVSGGPLRARQFLEGILIASPLIELAPLPFSVLFAVAWTLFDPPLRLLLVVGIILVALVVRGFAISLRQTQERVATVSLLNKFGQELVLAQLDEERLLALFLDYAARLLPGATFQLVLLKEDGKSLRAVPPHAPASGRLAELVPLILPMLQERPRGRLLPALTTEGLVGETQRPPTDRPARGSVLLIPLLASDNLLGVLAAESAEPDTLTPDDGRSLSVLATEVAVALQNARHFQQEQWRVRQLRTIAEVSRMVASVINLDELLGQVVELVCANFGYYHVQIYLVEPESNEVVYRAGSGEIGRKLSQLPGRLKIGSEGIIGWVAGKGEPLLVNDVSQDPRFLPTRASLLEGTRAELALPLKVEDSVLGVLDVQSDCVGGLDGDDLFTLTTLADQIAVAIQDARLHVAQREAAWVTTALLQLAEALNPLFELSSVLETICREVAPLMGMDGVALYLWRGEEGLFEGAESSGLPRTIGAAFKGHRVTARQFPLLEQIRAETRLITLTEAQCSLLVPGLAMELACELCLIALPMQAQGEFVGVMLLISYQPLPQLGPRRRSLALGVAQQAAVAIQAALLHTAQHEEAAITSDLLQVAEMIAGRADLEGVFELVPRLTVTMARTEQCVIYLWDDSRQCLLPAGAYGFSPEVEEAWHGTVLPARDMASFVLCWEATEPLILGEEGEHPLGCETLRVLFDGATVALIPLRAREEFLGVMIINLPGNRPRLTRRLRNLLKGMARQLSLAIENSRLYREALENERRTQELLLARQIQGALLPERAPDLPGYDIAAYWRPAREVAGDFYDFLRLRGNRFAFSIADVADKGIGAALLMVLTRSALRESLWSEEEAGRVLARTNKFISADVRNGMFLTLFLGILSPESGQLQVANAGHLPPLIYRAASESLVSTPKRNLPLGILEEVPYESATLVLEAGDTMVLITDGIMDTFNAEREPFGLVHLSELVYEHRHQGAQALIDTILDAVTRHAAGEPFDDDLSLLVVRRLP